MPFDVNIIGSICSILGLLISVLVFIYTFIINSKLTAIRGKILRNENLPDLIKDLKAHKSEFLKYYNDFENSTDQLKVKLQEVKVVAERTMKHLEGREKSHCKELRDAISSINKNYKFLNDKNKATFKDDVWEIFSLLSGVVQQIEYYYKDIQKFDNYV